MLQILETRLDNVVYHLGFANTRAAARQMVSHGHVKVNGRKVNIPSYSLKVNDTIEAKDSNVSRQLATKGLESSTSRAVPDWLSLNKDAFKGILMRVPTGGCDAGSKPFITASVDGLMMSPERCAIDCHESPCRTT